MANDIVILADQLFAAEPAGLDESLVDVGNEAFQISLRNDVGIGWQGNFALGDGLVVFHGPNRV